MCLRKEGHGTENRGSFLVCSPEELRKSVGWTEYVIVVRRTAHKEYREQRDKLKKENAESVVPKLKEPFPGGLEELASPIAYCKIRRGISGCYMVEQKLWFENLYALILHYQRDKNVDPNARLCNWPSDESIQLTGLISQSVPPPPTMPGHKEYDPEKTPVLDESSRRTEASQRGSAEADDGTYEKIGYTDIIDKSQCSWNKNPMKGRGNLGLRTLKGKWNSPKGEKPVVGKCLQALKKYVNDYEIEMKRDFLLKSDYIVPVHGVMYTTENNFLVISPWYEFGALDEYLKLRRKNENPLPQRGLLEILHQIVCGMKFAESQVIIHRNLAARNCLVTREDDDTVCVKISDFGALGAMDSDEFWDDIDKGDLLYKWMAVEVVNSTGSPKFTNLCDIWSFGIVIFEVLTHGDEPYIGMDLGDVQKHLGEGGRLPEKTRIPGSLLPLAESCWAEDPDERPTFKKLTKKFCELVYSTLGGSTASFGSESGTKRRVTSTYTETSELSGM